MDLPVVSVIVPVRNGERTIGACVESLLRQDYPAGRYEIIAVDNDSTDRTAATILRHPVVYVFENRGHSAAWARNRGIRAARGDIVAFTDADCVAAPTWLRRGVAGFSADRIGCVAGGIQAFPPRTPAQRYAEQRHALSQVWAMTQAWKPFAQSANAFYRRAVLEAIGLFDTSLPIGEDADLAWRMQDQLHLETAFRPSALVYHRHRETVRGFLKQRAGYGYGSVLLYRKYRDQMGRWTLKRTYWDARALARRTAHLLRATRVSLRAWDRGEPRWDPVVTAALDLGASVSWKLGQLRGSLQHRVWYV